MAQIPLGDWPSASRGSDFRGTGRNEANEDKGVVPRVSELMLFVAGYEDNVRLPDILPGTVAQHLAFPRVNENFMFPGVCVAGGVSAWSQFKNAHAEVVGTVVFADDHPSRDPFGGMAVKNMHGSLRVLNDLHENFLLESGEEGQNAVETILPRHDLRRGTSF